MGRPAGRPTVREILPDIDFIRLVEQFGVKGTARKLGIHTRSAERRKLKIETRTNHPIVSPYTPAHRRFTFTDFPWRVPLEVRNGIVPIFGDAHYWPSQKPSIMHRALVSFIKEYRKQIVGIITIGDVLDAPGISRWARIGWESRPDLCDEIEVAKERLHEIKTAAFKVPTIWLLGNHDARFETRLANVAPEYAKIHGVHLKDHFPLWEPGWSCWVNNGELVAKHKITSGKYAPQVDTERAGLNTAVGDKHAARVMPFTDYRGTRYGVDVGCIADTSSKQFVDYTQDNPLNWRSAFGVFTFKDGRLLMPELVTKWHDGEKVQFRGAVFAP